MITSLLLFFITIQLYSHIGVLQYMSSWFWVFSSERVCVCVCVCVCVRAVDFFQVSFVTEYTEMCIHHCHFPVWALVGCSHFPAQLFSALSGWGSRIMLMILLTHSQQMEAPCTAHGGFSLILSHVWRFKLHSVLNRFKSVLRLWSAPLEHIP